MKTLLTSPTPYVVWAGVVSSALFASYYNDPYVFGFTTLGLAWLTAAMGLLGLAACVFSKRPRACDRAIILGALAVAAAAIAKALDTLSGFNWA
jgi:1,4-dihydroxy-2-naphthoate octaprenyltransferase